MTPAELASRIDLEATCLDDILELEFNRAGACGDPDCCGGAYYNPPDIGTFILYLLRGGWKTSTSITNAGRLYDAEHLSQELDRLIQPIQLDAEGNYDYDAYPVINRGKEVIRELTVLGWTPPWVAE